MTRGVLANLAPERIATRWQPTLRYAILALLAGYVVFVAALWLAGAFEAEALGYPGVWLFSLIGASSIVLPIPGLAAVCAAATPAVGLNPLLLGPIAASAEAACKIRERSSGDSFSNSRAESGRPSNACRRRSMYC